MNKGFLNKSAKLHTLPRVSLSAIIPAGCWYQVCDLQSLKYVKDDDTLRKRGRFSVVSPQYHALRLMSGTHREIDAGFYGLAFGGKEVSDRAIRTRL